MPNIFLSYAREDFARAGTIAAALEKAGLTVWWDERISGGSEYSKEIEQALREADAVVVLWSAASVDSPWVRDEAAKGRDSGKLIPATLDRTEPPLGFGQFHTIDLSKRRRASRAMKQLISAAVNRTETGKSPAVPGAPSERQKPAVPGRRWPSLAIAAAAALVVILAGLYLVIGNPLGSRATGDLSGGKVAIGEFEPVSSEPELKSLARLTSETIERIFATNFIQTVSAQSAPANALADADFAIRGTVDRADDRAIISATITELKSGRTLWSTRLERPASERRELADAMAIWLADVMRCSIYTKRRMPEHTSSEVSSRILRACEAERSAGEQYDQLPKLAQALVDVAPKSAQAHAYLANALALRSKYPPEEVYAAANKALELDPKNGAVRFALAIVADPEVSLADRERLLREGLALDPEFLWFKSQLALLMEKVGRRDEARQLTTEFVGDYPLDHLMRWRLGLMELEHGNFQEGRRQIQMTDALRPGQIARPVMRAEALFGEPAEAHRWLKRANTSDKERRCAARIIDVLAERRATGEKVDVGECRRSWISPPAERPQLDIALGDIDRAYAGIDDLIRRDAWLPRFGPNYVFENYAAPFRADPRFMPMMARLGIAQYWLETNKWPDFCSRDRLPYACREAAKAAVASAGR